MQSRQRTPGWSTTITASCTHISSSSKIILNRSAECVLLGRRLRTFELQNKVEQCDGVAWVTQTHEWDDQATIGKVSEKASATGSSEKSKANLVIVGRVEEGNKERRTKHSPDLVNEPDRSAYDHMTGYYPGSLGAGLARDLCFPDTGQPLRSPRLISIPFLTFEAFRFPPYSSSTMFRTSLRACTVKSARSIRAARSKFSESSFEVCIPDTELIGLFRRHGFAEKAKEPE